MVDPEALVAMVPGCSGQQRWQRLTGRGALGGLSQPSRRPGVGLATSHVQSARQRRGQCAAELFGIRLLGDLIYQAVLKGR